MNRLLLLVTLVSLSTMLLLQVAVRPAAAYGCRPEFPSCQYGGAGAHTYRSERQNVKPVKSGQAKHKY